MNSLVAALFAFATVSASPFVLDSHLLSDKEHAKLSVFHYSSFVDGSGSSAPKLRFVHLVPKFSHLSEFSGGLGSQHGGSSVKHHSFLKFDSEEKLVELLGLSDCHSWHSAVLGVWSSSSGSLVHKFYSWVSGESVKVLGSLDDLVDFVHVHLDLGHKKVYNELVKKGLSSHPFTLKLHSKVSSSHHL